ncbi:hypothetical protein Q5M85_16635 [Paraclostridium bifermentans]|nr:hypothetical protein [Paraclostridium bifermentans]
MAIQLISLVTGLIIYKIIMDGSGYSNPQEDLDILKTGNLIVEMKFLNRSQANSSVLIATDYIANNWYEPAYFSNPGWNSSPVANYQATYALMSGLTGYEFDTINQSISPFEEIDYASDVTSVLLQQQNPDGSFKSNPNDPEQSDPDDVNYMGIAYFAGSCHLVVMI